MAFNEENPRKGGGKGFLTGLVGGIIGALIVAMLYPPLLGGGGDSEIEREQAATVEQGKGPSEKVSLDVTTDVTEAIDKAAQTVVGITNIQTAGFWSAGEEDQQAAGVGSGVFYKKEGDKAYIVTNHHVVEGAQQLEVTLSDGRKVPGELEGTDVWTDLAVVSTDAKEIEDSFIAEFGDSETLRIGEPVLAIGNPLGLEFAGSVTQGIVSGVNRTVPVDINRDGVPDWNAEVIQTDAAINPGNSGGALVNIAGQLVGINSMKIAQSAVEGIGFSIPVNYVEPIISDLEKYGEVRRPAMGITLRDVAEISAYHQEQTLKLPEDVTTGIMIEQVVPNSPADQGGLQELDVIVALDDQEVENVIELRKYLYNNKNVGDQMTVTYYRGGEKQETTLELTDDTRL